MDKDAIALSLVIVSAVALLATAHLVWFVVFMAGSVYGGWRLGQRLIPAEKHGV